MGSPLFLFFCVVGYPPNWGKWPRYIDRIVDYTSPITWWNGMCSSTELSKVASGILSLPPTSASVERACSHHSHMRSSDCNRLTTDRAAKLVFIAYNLALEDNEHLPANQSSALERGNMPSTSERAVSATSPAAPAPVPFSNEHDAPSESESDISLLDVTGHETSDNDNSE